MLGAVCADDGQNHLRPGNEMISIEEMELSFQDDFQTPSIVSRAPFSNYHKNTKWLAHTPWNGDFGDARFIDPGAGGPFNFTKNGLTITARKTADGAWTSGLICSVDRDGDGQQGFTQKYGYFELRAKLPDGSGVWPAFWLVGTDKSNGSTEIDVLEYYGKYNAGFHTVLHFWSKDAPRHQDFVIDVPAGSLTNSFHDYGILITETTTKFFFDRRKYLEIATPEDFRQPLYILVNLALGGGWPIDDLASPAVMHVEHVRAYKKLTR
ncbi:glycoside hydrolase family 16 protein [Methylobacterium sp. WL18]|uniref:glycoside hydrolase family 16 protein n=1 Tax=Methylobacterium sp. WL18 TaxID=2603897 RepID=UPI00164F97D9|nr:glycoside hydrolase family 16 protein [Methylobacterium sp. WL18]